MKKTVCMLLALLLLLPAFAHADGQGIFGKWYSSEMRSDQVTFIGQAQGIEVVIDFQKNGQCELASTRNGERDTAVCAWNLEDAYGVIDNQYEFVYSGSRINLFIDGVEVLLTRKKPAEIPKNSIARVGVMVEDMTYTGKKLKPTVAVTLDGATLKEGVDYAVRYRNNKAVGRATAIVSGKGSFTGQINGYFDIHPKPVTVKAVSAGKKALTVRWAPRTVQTSGYIIEYATSKTFKNARSESISNASVGSLTVRKLRSGRKYYVRVAAYTASGQIIYYSDWSPVKSVTVK